jgi:hypothetical protein
MRVWRSTNSILAGWLELMIRYAAVVVLVLAGCVFLRTEMSWVYIAAAIAMQVWLRYSMAALDREPVPVDEPPWHFSEEEARLVGRYAFYFHSPAMAKACASMLAALGLTSLLLALWLTYHQAIVQAVLIAANVLTVSRLTKLVAPVHALQQSASRGDREALRMLEAHETAWAKIRAANAAMPSD